MKLLYVSEHRFIKKSNGEVFTTGQMGEKYFNRFMGVFDSVTVIGMVENENDGNKNKIIEKINVDSKIIKYILVESSGTIIGRLQANKKIKMKYIKLLKQYDRIATKVPSLIGNFVVRLANKHSRPILVEIVGCPWDAFWNHSIKGKLVAPFMWLQTKKTVKNAPYAMYVTNEFLQSRYPCKGKTTGCSDVILPTLDESILEKRLNKIKHRNVHKPIVLGTIAAVNVRYKGQEYVIKAVSMLNKQGFNFEYSIAGGGDNSYLKSVAEKYNILDKIKFLGSLPHQKVFQYLDNIDVYIQPSKTEGLPRALVEAMSRGCPALGSKVGGIPELLNKDFIFNSGSVEKMIHILKNMDEKILLQEAKRSFNKAKEYDKYLLNDRRKTFLIEFSHK